MHIFLTRVQFISLFYHKCRIHVTEFVFKIKSTSCSVPNSEERSYLRAVKLAEIDIYQRHYAVNSAIREPL